LKKIQNQGPNKKRGVNIMAETESGAKLMKLKELRVKMHKFKTKD
jgi:hypothetical protein